MMRDHTSRSRELGRGIVSERIVESANSTQCSRPEPRPMRDNSTAAIRHLRQAVHQRRRPGAIRVPGGNGR
jgi:hypothetical protein